MQNSWDFTKSYIQRDLNRISWAKMVYYIKTWIQKLGSSGISENIENMDSYKLVDDTSMKIIQQKFAVCSSWLMFETRGSAWSEQWTIEPIEPGFGMKNHSHDWGILMVHFIYGWIHWMLLWMVYHKNIRIYTLMVNAIIYTIHTWILRDWTQSHRSIEVSCCGQKRKDVFEASNCMVDKPFGHCIFTIF